MKTSSTTAPFAIGDIVVLRGDVRCPDMTVIGSNTEGFTIAVFWCGEGVGFKEHVFPTAILELRHLGAL